MCGEPVTLSAGLSSVTQGARTQTIAYDAQGYPQTLTDALGRTTTLANDPVGRVLSEVLPGGRPVAFSYDRNGNLSSVAPPGRPAHGFGYTPADLTSVYTPPLASGAGLLSTSYSYDLDGALSRVLLPDQIRAPSSPGMIRPGGSRR